MAPVCVVVPVTPSEANVTTPVLTSVETLRPLAPETVMPLLQVNELYVTAPATPNVLPNDTAPDRVVALVTVRALSVVVPPVLKVPLIARFPVVVIVLVASAPVVKPARVVAPTTPNVLPKETAPVSVVVPLTVRLPVVAIVPVLIAAKVVTPVTPKVLPKLTAPLKVVLPETLMELGVKAAVVKAAVVTAANVVTPPTPNVPLMAKLPVVVMVPVAKAPVVSPLSVTAPVLLPLMMRPLAAPATAAGMPVKPAFVAATTS